MKHSLFQSILFSSIEIELMEANEGIYSFFMRMMQGPIEDWMVDQTPLLAATLGACGPPHLYVKKALN